MEVIAGSWTGRPASSAFAMASAPTVSTPQMRTWGFNAFTAVATPPMKPPPPMLTTRSVRSGASSRIFEPHRTLSGDHLGIVERMHRQPPVGFVRGYLLESSRGVFRKNHPRTVPACAVHIICRSAGGHDDLGWNLQMRGHVSDGLGMIAAAHCHQTFSVVFFAGAQYFVKGSSYLERAGLLKQFELEGNWCTQPPA